MRIGYQGSEHNDVFVAAKEMAKEKLVKKPEFVPFPSIFMLFEKLHQNKIDAIVVPVNNSKMGIIEENIKFIEETQKLGIEVDMEKTIKVDYLLCKKNDNILDEEIKFIASNMQAFKECDDSINKYFPKAIKIYTEDKLLEVDYLKEDKFPEGTAIITLKGVIDKSTLHIDKERFQDDEDNATTYVWLRK